MITHYPYIILYYIMLYNSLLGYVLHYICHTHTYDTCHISPLVGNVPGANAVGAVAVSRWTDCPNIALAPREKYFPKFLPTLFPLGVVIRFRAVVVERITRRRTPRVCPPLASLAVSPRCLAEPWCM